MPVLLTTSLMMSSLITVRSGRSILTALYIARKHGW